MVKCYLSLISAHSKNQTDKEQHSTIRGLHMEAFIHADFGLSERKKEKIWAWFLGAVGILRQQPVQHSSCVEQNTDSTVFTHCGRDKYL